MRYYKSAYELFSEVLRDAWEMGITVKPKSYQDKIVEGDDDFITKELPMYSYCLTNLPDPENLFLLSGIETREWCNAEFKERVNPDPSNPGEAWALRKDLWEKFLESSGKFSYTYGGRLNYNQNLLRIIQEAISNPDSRQLWLPIFTPEDVKEIGGKRRVPCSLGYFFMVREGQVNLHYIQRSADIVAHWGNDIYLAWLMLSYFAWSTHYRVGYLYHTIFSLHSYKKDWEILNNGISKLSNHGK